MKKIFTGMLVLGLLVGGYLGWNRWKQEKDQENRLPPGLTATIGRQTIDLAVEGSGDIAPVVEVEVKSEVSAKIKKLHVELGESVKQGQLLVELDDQQLLTEKASAEIEISGARLELAKAKDDFDRDKRLFEKQLIPEKSMTATRTAMDLAQNSLEGALKKIQNVNDRLDKTKIMAPMDGVVLELPVVEGQVVVGAGSVNSGTMLMRLANLEKLLIDCHINQVDVTRLKPGMPFSFTVDSLSGTEMMGHISTIAPRATVVRNIKGFNVEFMIDEPDPRLRPGMTSDIKVLIERVENALAVPLAAVFSEGGKKVVFVQPPGPGEQVETREVETGISNIDFVQIKSGVREGETVLLVRPQPAAQ